MMRWSLLAADALLRRAFPWGAHVTVPSGSAFLSVRHDVVDIEHGPDRATLRFERDPGDTVQVVDRLRLERAADTRALEFDGGGGCRQPATADLHLLAFPFRDLIAYQAQSDSKWVARMRLHQSWWRTFRLRAAFGAGPTPSSTKRYGNMLDSATADAGLNFLTADARASYDARVALTHKGVDPWRTRRNLLASQPLAFNLFGHLSRHLEIATGLFRHLLGDKEVGAVTSVEIERLSDALGDRTAFDAFATYLRPGGTTGCIAIETKLTEPFSQKAYNWDYYRDHGAFDAEVWTTSDTATLGDRRWSQLWRNHLLARAESAAKSPPRTGDCAGRSPPRGSALRRQRRRLSRAAPRSEQRSRSRSTNDPGPTLRTRGRG